MREWSRRRFGGLILAGSLIFPALPSVAIAQEAGAKQEVPKPGRHMWGPGKDWRKSWWHKNMSPRHNARMQRHWKFMNGDIPVRFQKLTNPVEDSTTALGKGEKLYAKHCATCHGIDGLGDGEAGHDLYPSPALLAMMVQMPIAVDSYLMWTISEGGKEFDTKMPAFKDTLSVDETWQVITYMRNGFALP